MAGVRQLSKARYKVCRECEFRRGPRCTVCGCFVVVKSMVPNAKCPKGLWPTTLASSNEKAEN